MEAVVHRDCIYLIFPLYEVKPTFPVVYFYSRTNVVFVVKCVSCRGDSPPPHSSVYQVSVTVTCPGLSAGHVLAPCSVTH